MTSVVACPLSPTFNTGEVWLIEKRRQGRHCPHTTRATVRPPCNRRRTGDGTSTSQSSTPTSAVPAESGLRKANHQCRVHLQQRWIDLVPSIDVQREYHLAPDSSSRPPLGTTTTCGYVACVEPAQTSTFSTGGPGSYDCYAITAAVDSGRRSDDREYSACTAGRYVLHRRTTWPQRAVERRSDDGDLG